MHQVIYQLTIQEKIIDVYKLSKDLVGITATKNQINIETIVGLLQISYSGTIKLHVTSCFVYTILNAKKIFQEILSQISPYIISFSADKIAFNLKTCNINLSYKIEAKISSDLYSKKRKIIDEIYKKYPKIERKIYHTENGGYLKDNASYIDIKRSYQFKSRHFSICIYSNTRISIIAVDFITVNEISPIITI